MSDAENAVERGRAYLDVLDPLAFAYDGLILVAVAYREDVVREWEEASPFTVVRTPEGEEVLCG